MKLWLDPSRKQDFAFISHAHADHAARHRKILATTTTSRILKHRLGMNAHITCSFGEPLQIGSGSVTLYPAGHILGSAQVLVELGDERLLYTGDFKLQPSRTAEPCRPVSCDYLIMECTYGLPQYRFPERAGVESHLVDSIVDVMERGEVPVVLAYALGRAQEVIQLLISRGFKVALERRIFELALIYEELGVELGPYESFDPQNFDGRVLIFPPHLWNSPVLRRIPRKRTIAVTGWAIDGRQRSWYRSDMAFPISDHADFDDLTRYVEITQPRQVYLIHGFPDFAQHLEKKGVNVTSLI